ncbi:MAG TPA: SRPBCC family protein [Steroidobacteraceae bacterium]
MSEITEHPRDDAPIATAKHPAKAALSAREDAGSDIIGRSVTVDRPRQELYLFWRDFRNLPLFMTGIRRVEVDDAEHARWFVGRGGGTDQTFVWNTVILADRPDELIAWRTSDGTETLHEGSLQFRDAIGGRGAVVTATISYDQSGGRIGELIARILHRDPKVQARRDLRRFKQLMETGELATAAPPYAAPRA